MKKALFLTNEYPPYVYGGAGVHVDYLSRELAKLMEIEVRAFGDQKSKSGNLQVTGFGLDTGGFTCPKQLQSVFGAVRRCTDFNTTAIDADVVHCHTWYTHLGGILAKLNYGIPLVITVHSLEPLRPWKREQLGGGYEFSRWVEKTAIEMADAVIAVSRETKTDILRLFDVSEERVRIIHNGIDLDEYKPVKTTAALIRYGIDPEIPFVLFVGRITRQKGSSIWSTRSNTWPQGSRLSFVRARRTPRDCGGNENRRRGRKTEPGWRDLDRGDGEQGNRL